MNAFTPSSGLVTTGNARSIGDILVANGRLSPEDSKRILERQTPSVNSLTTPTFPRPIKVLAKRW